jgi:hypothetical protein
VFIRTRQVTLGLSLTLLAALACLCCGSNPMQTTDAFANGLKSIPPETWNALSHKRIYFGHQSVGYNIVEGISRLEKDNPEIRLTLKETSDPRQITPGTFAHSRIGKNQEPLSKIAGFRQVMDSGVGNEVDVAFLKFCYVDFDERTDIDSLFQAYRSAMTALETAHPNVAFVHLTVPLQQFQFTWKPRLMRLLGMPVYGEAASRARLAFNEKMRAAYGKGNRLFDLADWESTSQDGNPYRVKIGGELLPSLVPEFTDDGGHLNSVGQVHVSRQLIRFLAGIG